jgi:hypothetical protein
MSRGRSAFHTFFPYLTSTAARNDSPALSIGTISRSFTSTGDAAIRPGW